ncbi:MAG TPA: histidine--tRNA ligase [Anaerolineae bacterium]|nr:histidine--tRNA ligase [Anaerolineae bacterium]
MQDTKAKRVEPRLPRGMRDILPQKMIQREYVIATIRRAFEEFGFEPLQTPALELRETLMGKYGPDAEKLIYEAGHVGGKEQLALRYDLSVPLARVVAQYPDLVKPLKRYQIAPVWRAERPQKGRYREFYQCDADCVGPASMLADAEILSLTYEVLSRLGFRQFTILLNDRKLLNGIGRYAGVDDEQRAGLYRSIDKLDKVGLPGVEEELRKNAIPDGAIQRMLELLQVQGDNRAILARLRVVLAGSPDALEGLSELEEIVGYLEALGIPERFARVSPAMVRGLEYYTGPVFETVVEEPKIGSITGGGRYDKMIGMFTGRSLPATGTTIGIERIIDVMEELGMFPPGVGKTVTQVLVTRFNPDLVVDSLKAAAALRAAGLNAELYFEDESLARQVRYADRRGIPYVAILGPDEVAAGRITLRDLAGGRQVTVARDAAPAQLETWRHEA